MFEDNPRVKIFESLHDLKNIRLGEILADLSFGEFMTLGAIDRFSSDKGGKLVTVAVLSEAARTSVPAMSRTLKNLEEKKFVERITDKTNRRNTNVMMTELGGQVFEKNVVIMKEYMQRVISHFSDEELELFIALHKKFVQYCIEELGRV